MTNTAFNFRVSAPGKVILHGEHSVVYGKAAIAGPINLRTLFECKTIEDPSIFIKYLNLDFECRISLLNFKTFLDEVDCLTDLDPLKFLYQLRSASDFVLKYVSFTSATKLTSTIEMAVCVMLYILNRILKEEAVQAIKKGMHIEISSEMSIGAGLGSSASYGVCIAAGSYIISQRAKGFPMESFHFDDALLLKISKWAFDSEVIMHERPSGIDNTIATYGNLIKFRRGQEHNNINLRMPLNILIVDTATSRSTSKMVQRVSELQTAFPNIINNIFISMGYLVDDAAEILAQEDTADAYKKLEQLFSINNNLLRSIGVSHMQLEKVFNIVESQGFKAKLTGAGGGGCAIVLLPPNYLENNNYRLLCDDLTKNNFSWKKTVIGGFGVDFKCLST